MKTAGIEVCAAGYLGICLDENEAGYWLLESDDALRKFLKIYDRVFIDIPIGLPEYTEMRECDRFLRDKLGSNYKENVIDPPIRDAIAAPTYGEASVISYEKIGKQIPMQSWSLVPQIRAVQNFLEQDESYSEFLFESHPELLYQILNGENAILQKKATKKGLRHRLHLLKEANKYVDDFFRDIKEEYRRNQVEEEKIIDAMVLALFAYRSIDESIKTLPEDPPIDNIGLPMAFHYV